MFEEEKSRQEVKAEEEKEREAFKMTEDWGPLGVIVYLK